VVLWIYGGCWRIRESGKRIDALAYYEELKEALERWSIQRRQVRL
jgi:exonuclease III